MSHVQQEIKVVHDQMQILFQQPSDGVEWDLRSSLFSKLESLLTQEEAHWKQWSKVTWLQDGDQNTRYFHQKASNRRQKNSIKGLFDANNTWCVSSGDIEQVVVDYFSFMFKSNGEFPCDVILESVPKRVAQDINRMLCADYLDIEIKEAFFQMDPHTAHTQL